MKLISILFVSLFCLQSFASTDLPGGLQINPQKVVEDLAKKQLGEDFKTVVTFVQNSNLCGADGDVFIVEVQVKKWMKTFCGNDDVCLMPNWETVKTYGILDSEVSKDASLTDYETCLE